MNFQDRYLAFKNNVDIVSFYKSFNETEFKNIGAKKLIDLKKISKKMRIFSFFCF